MALPNTPEAAQPSEKSCFLRTKCCLGLSLKYVVGPSLGLFIYCLDILTDINVARTDFQEGDSVYGCITLGLVFLPGLLYGLYMVFETLLSYKGLLKCIKVPSYIILIPVFPIWPIIRDCLQIYHGAMVVIKRDREKHIEAVKQPSRAYLVKFLEAFTEAAPQLLVRLVKISTRSNLAFVDINSAEITQISFSLTVLSLKIPSTYQKSITTKMVLEGLDGEVEEEARFKIPCLVKLLAIVWWFFFLVARLEALALFAGSFTFWVLLVIGVHVCLVLAFQTAAAPKKVFQQFFVYLFSAFVFIFAYIQLNVISRMKKARPWVPYTIFTVLVFVENSIMMVVWFIYQLRHIDSLETAYRNSTLMDQSSASPMAFLTQEIDSVSPEEAGSMLRHSKILLLVHYVCFALGSLFMVFTFIHPFKVDQEEYVSANKNAVREVKPMLLRPITKENKPPV